MSRKTDYTKKLAAEICEAIMSGKSLREICRGDGMPARSTVHKWLAERDDFSDQYARACDIRADVVFDEIFAIADTPVDGEKRKITSDGKEEITTGDMIEHRRLQIDARKWALARMAPKKYGDKLDLNHDGNLSINLPSHTNKL